MVPCGQRVVTSTPSNGPRAESARRAVTEGWLAVGRASRAPAVASGEAMNRSPL